MVLFREAIGLIVFLSLWLSALVNKESLPDSMTSSHFLASFKIVNQSNIHLLPLYLLALFAFYSIWQIGYSVMFFPTCPKAAENLRKDMIRTQKELVKLGVFTAKEIKDMNNI